MPRFQIYAHVDDYQRYVIEAKDELDAGEKAQESFERLLDSLRLITLIDVEEVPDDTPLGDN